MKSIYKNIEDVPVWKDSHQFVLNIYKITKKFPKEELFGLTSQLRQSSSSVPANIVEGFYRNSTKELIHFLYNARGSLGESNYHILLAKDLRYITEKEYEDLTISCESISKQLNGWIKSLKAKL